MLSKEPLERLKVAIGIKTDMLLCSLRLFFGIIHAAADGVCFTTKSLIAFCEQDIADYHICHHTSDKTQRLDVAWSDRTGSG